MRRKIIKINEALCNGCGICVSACHEGAIGMVDGKAKLLRDDYCDGLGNCLPVCPAKAITFEEREAAAYDDEAVKGAKSALRQWPVQIKLIPVNAPYFSGQHLLIAADCSAYAYANFHQDFIRDKITLIGCPKLDACDYTEKLTQILKQNDIQSVTVVRMEVPCCGGIESAAKGAVLNCGKEVPYQVVIISTEGYRVR